jgi:hypothetical protein
MSYSVTIANVDRYAIPVIMPEKRYTPSTDMMTFKLVVWCRKSADDTGVPVVSEYSLTPISLQGSVGWCFHALFLILETIFFMELLNFGLEEKCFVPCTFFIASLSLGNFNIFILPPIFSLDHLH